MQNSIREVQRHILMVMVPPIHVGIVDPTRIRIILSFLALTHMNWFSIVNAVIQYQLIMCREIAQYVKAILVIPLTKIVERMYLRCLKAIAGHLYRCTLRLI